jgi:hypothetical protein
MYVYKSFNCCGNYLAIYYLSSIDITSYENPSIQRVACAVNYLVVISHLLLLTSLQSDENLAVDPKTLIPLTGRQNKNTDYAAAVEKVSLSSRDRCYDFKNILAKKVGEKMAFLTQSKA